MLWELFVTARKLMIGIFHVLAAWMNLLGCPFIFPWRSSLRPRRRRRRGRQRGRRLQRRGRRGGQLRRRLRSRGGGWSRGAGGGRGEHSTSPQLYNQDVFGSCWNLCACVMNFMTGGVHKIQRSWVLVDVVVYFIMRQWNMIWWVYGHQGPSSKAARAVRIANITAINTKIMWIQ